MSVGSPDVRARIRSVLVLLTLLGGPVGLLATAAAAAPAAPTQVSGLPAATGLSVSIDELSPTALQPGDDVEVQGTVTNLDAHRWQAVNAFLVISAGALTTAQELQDAADSPDTSYIGDRVVEPNAYDEVGNLAPGASATYSLRVPYRLLGITGAPGVYQLGVQMIGTDVDGTRSLSAIGRARTFLPLLEPDGAASVRTSLLWPLLAPVRRVADGRVVNTDHLVALCSPGGRLRTLLDMARAGQGSPLTLVLDPGLLDALGDIVLGSQPSPLTAAGNEGDGKPTAADGPPEAPAAPDALAQLVGTEPTGDESPEQRAVRLWLADLVALTQDVPVWATGYAQPDLAALPTRASRDVSLDPVRVPVADRLRATVGRATEATLRSFDISATSLWWPPQGYADTTDLARAAVNVRASILAGASLPNRSETSPSLLRVDTAAGLVDVVVDDPAYRDGGPGPGDTNAALQVRQRIAAETALQALALTAQGRRAGSATVVVDRFWDPGTQWATAAFFTAFSTPWTKGATTQEQLDRDLPTYQGTAVVPEGVLTSTLPAAVTRTAALLDRRGGVLTELVRGPAATDAVGLFFDEETATALSQRWRPRPDQAQTYARRSAGALAGELHSLSVEVPDFVTLSSRSGSFGVTISNGSDHAVTVGVDFDSGGGLFTLPDVEPIAVGAGERRTVLVDASVTDVAVDQVTARLTTAGGSHFGPPTTFTLRTSVLGVAIWIALGTGAGFVLLVALRRTVRRARTSRAAR